jgi:hypothetical protein
MEREKEIAKLVNVLRRTSRMALQSEWTGGSQDVAAFCIDQYNRVLARLKQIDPDVESVFDPLAASSSLTVAAMACRQLAAYYEDEVARSGGWGDPRYGVWVDKRAFKEFWNKSAREIEDFGEFIRENIDEWLSQRKARDKQQEAGERKTAPINPEETKPQ